MDKVVSLCKRRGFIFQSSSIYGGLANTWDYGPYGVELKNNVKRAWWRANVYERDDVFGLDAAILMHPKTWEASGHVESFKDPFTRCTSCQSFFRTDKLWEEIWNSGWFKSIKEENNLQNLDAEAPEFKNLIYKMYSDKIPCPNCKTPLPNEPMSVNLMLETYLGPLKETAQKIYLRPETAQGMFVNFINIIDTKHPKLPFGIAQIGKAFRNEISPGNFLFRTREFEQMEIEYFVHPDTADNKHQEWIETRFNWYINLGIKKENLRKRPHSKDELAHYAKACTDIEYKFPFGWSELEGIANRTDFDLRRHSATSGVELMYFDDVKKERFYPYIIEPSGGVDRSVLAFLVDAYYEEMVKGEKRVVLRLHKDLAPVKVAVFPLLKNRPEIVEMAKKIAKDLKKDFITVYDDTGAIGKLYRRQDEVGTLYCITVDVQSLQDKKVTVRDRDTMLQDRVSIEKIKEYLKEKL